MTRHQPTITDLLAGLRAARTDDRVKALVAKVGGKPIGLGVSQELREAISRFRAAGKPTWAWAESFGEFSAGNVPYYLATAFDTIYLQPSGDLGLTGLAVERPFLRGTLDKLGVQLEVGARYEYKGAPEQLTERGFTPANREATQRIAESVTSQIAQAIAERGQISAEQASNLIDQGPYLAEQALAAGLVDALGYRDEVYAALRKQVGNDPALLFVGRYQRSRELAQPGQAAGGTTPAGRRADPGDRRDPARPQRPQPADRHRHGLGQHHRGPAGRDGRSACSGHRAAGEQPGRLVCRLRLDLA